MGIFSQDSGFVKFMNRALDVLVINLLWLAFSIPIVTMGAATTAAYYVMLKLVDDEESYVGKMFIKAFKDNFKQATIMWCITAPLIYLGILMWQFIAKGDAEWYVILGAIVYSAAVITTNLYTYPLMARYENSLKNTVRNSFGICFQFFTKTILIVVLLAVELVIFFWCRPTMIAGLVIGGGLMIYTVSAISKKIFLVIEQLKPEEETENTEDETQADNELQ